MSDDANVLQAIKSLLKDSLSARIRDEKDIYYNVPSTISEILAGIYEETRDSRIELIKIRKLLEQSLVSPADKVERNLDKRD